MRRGVRSASWGSDHLIWVHHYGVRAVALHNNGRFKIKSRSIPSIPSSRNLYRKEAVKIII